MLFDGRDVPGRDRIGHIPEGCGFVQEEADNHQTQHQCVDLQKDAGKQRQAHLGEYQQVDDDSLAPVVVSIWAWR